MKDYFYDQKNTDNTSLFAQNTSISFRIKSSNAKVPQDLLHKYSLLFVQSYLVSVQTPPLITAVIHHLEPLSEQESIICSPTPTINTIHLYIYNYHYPKHCLFILNFYHHQHAGVLFASRWGIGEVAAPAHPESLAQARADMGFSCASLSLRLGSNGG